MQCLLLFQMSNTSRHIQLMSYLVIPHQDPDNLIYRSVSSFSLAVSHQTQIKCSSSSSILWQCFVVYQIRLIAVKFFRLSHYDTVISSSI